MKALFDQTSYTCSTITTKAYSTSFSLGIRLLAPSIRPAIYAIYGFVRYADEIVDTFHDYPQRELFDEFIADYHKSLERGISLNPILNAFQHVVKSYALQDLVESFLQSMEWDLSKKEYATEKEYEQYIYGSADVVGLMCLRVFVAGDEKKYTELKDYAMRLGSAFQKVNFLRDIKDDFEVLGRSYFPNVERFKFDNATKQEIIADVEADFKEAFKGVLMLPVEGKFGVYIAYRYYSKLLKRLKRKNSKEILEARTRISNPDKMSILVRSYIRYKINML